jgi:uncharacterized protein YceK
MNLLRKLSVVAVLSIGATGLSGCAGVAFAGTGAPGFSSFYANTTSKNWVNETTRLGSKSGEACMTSILGLVTTGDGSVTKAAEEAHISRITHIDQKFENLLGLYAKYCIVVYGD